MDKAAETLVPARGNVGAPGMKVRPPERDGARPRRRTRAGAVRTEQQPNQQLATEQTATSQPSSHDGGGDDYRLLLEVASDWVWETDAEHRFTYFSPNFQHHNGYSPYFAMGKRRDELVRASLSEAQWREHERTLAERRPFRDLVCRAATQDGRVQWLRINGHPRFARDGTFLGYRGANRDVTAEVEAQAALKEGERRLQALLDISPDWVWETDADLRFTYFSPNIVTTLGTTPDQLVGRLGTEIGAVDSDQESWQEYLAALRAHEPVRGFVFRRTFHNGRSIWVKTSGTPLFDAAGKFTGYRGVARNVTAEIERQQAELELRRFHEAVAELPHPFVMFNEKEQLVAFNRAFAALHHGPDGKCILRDRMTFGEIAEWRIRTGFYADAVDGGVADKDTLLRQLSRKGEVTCRLRDGRWMLVERHSFADGSSAGIWTDITAVKRAEEERRSLEDQIHHANRLKSLGTLAGGIAHDVNNSLVPVIAMTKRVLAKLPPDSSSRGSLELVLKGGERAKELVQQILAFSRKEKGAKRPFDLANVVTDTLKLLRASIPSTITLATHIDPVPLIEGDPGQWHQVVLNLGTNAAQAIEHRIGTITLELRHVAGEDSIRLSVADTGRGMDEVTRQRVFEPFFTTKEVGRGTGLGLSVVHGIVVDHGGTISVATTPGAGTRFDIALSVAALRPSEPTPDAAPSS